MSLTRPYITDIFVEIGAVRRIRGAISAAMDSPYPSYIVSDPGYGKTTALFCSLEECAVADVQINEAHRSNSLRPTAMRKPATQAYVQIGEAHKNIAGMYLAVLTAFKVVPSSTFERQLFDQVINDLSPSKWELDAPRKLLIVDEFQTLEDRAKRELLKIQETCGFALVLAGNSERIMSSGKKDVKALQQIEDRIGIRVALPPLDDGDCVAIGSAYGVEGMDAYKAITAFGTGTNVRALARLLQQAKRLTGGTAAIQLHHIKTAVLALYGKNDALKLLTRKDD